MQKTIAFLLLIVKLGRVLGIVGVCKNNLVCGLNDISFDITNKLEDTGNYFVSPLGLSMVLGMAYLGANGNTAEQFEETLKYNKYNISSEQVHEQMKNLHKNIIEGCTNGSVIRIANALFYAKDANIESRFIDYVKDFYQGDSLPQDFAGEPVESTNNINNWVKEKTEEKINKLIAEPLPSGTQAVLTDAIYFKGTWKTEFPPNLTYPGYFYKNNSANGYIMVPLMSLVDETFPYLKDDALGYKFLELPYKGKRFSMVFALPIKHDQKPDLKMTGESYCDIRKKMVETKLENIVIPKFKLSYQKKLKETMQSLGLIDAFSPGLADLSGISSGSQLYISDILQKTFIEVNEQGSEAAAVSGIQIMPVSFRERLEFVANHPFLFYILDTKSQAILFAGRLEDPTV